MRIPFLLTLLLCLLGICDSYAQSAWNTLHDFSPEPDVYYSHNVAHVLGDTFFIAAGNTGINGVSGYLTYVSKLNYKGTVLHKRVLQSPASYHLIESNSCLQKLSNNKYVIGGVELDYTANSKIVVQQPYFYFFNSSLDSVLQVNYRDTLVSRVISSVVVDKEKNIIVGGRMSSDKLKYIASSSSYVYDTFYTWIAKYDSNANLLWERKFNGIYGDPTLKKIIIDNNGTDYVFVALKPGKTFLKPYVGKIDVDGTISFMKDIVLRYDMSDVLVDIVSLKSGGYAFAATVDTIPGPNTNANITCYGRIDKDFDMQWSKLFIGPFAYQVYSIANIREANNGDLLILTHPYYAYDRDNGNALVRALPNGDIKWYRDYKIVDTASGSDQKLVAMVETPDNRLLLSGHMSSQITYPSVFDTAGMFSWFVLTDTFGCLKPGCQGEDTMWHTSLTNIDAAPQLSIYPNPAQGVVYIEATQLNGSATATLIDMQGRMVQSINLQGNTRHSANISQLPPGMYIIELRQNNRVLQRSRLSHY